MEKLENVAMGGYTTMGVGGQVAYLLRATNVREVIQANTFAVEQDMPLVVLGEGSNSIFVDGKLRAVVLKIEIAGFEVVREGADFAEVKVGAGESWDSVVSRAVELGFSGIEALSAIPGTAGATPVQNVGAYGQEIRNVLVSVDVYDRLQDEMVKLSNAECKLSYRDSIFRSGKSGRYIITSILLRLSKNSPQVPDYAGVQKYFDENKIQNPTLVDIRMAIITIRANKLPDPKKIKNSGSFFKNPVVDRSAAGRLLAEYPNMPHFPQENAAQKLSAGWLIEQAGLKGADFGNMKTYENNALVLINKGNASFSDLTFACDEIIRKVKEKFSITLDPEPVVVK